MASFLDDSTDEEIGVNLQLAERLRINRGDSVYSNNRIFTEKDHKQLSNQRKKNIYCGEQSSSSSSLELPNEACCSGYSNAYGPHNKKRQNGDKNIELLANPKRTCLSDRFGSAEVKYGKSKSTNRDINCLTRKEKYPPKPLNLRKKGIYPDNTYEDCNAFSDDDDDDFQPWRPFDRMKKTNNVERTVKKPGNTKPERAGPESVASSYNGVHLIESSEDDSRNVRQIGALKGGRQSPELGALRKVLGRKVKALSESEDEESDDNIWQRRYRTRRLVFSSSDSDDSGLNSKVSKKPVDLALKKSANLSFSPLDPLNSNHDHVYCERDVPAPDVPYEEPFQSSVVQKQINHRGRPAPKTSKNRSSSKNPVHIPGAPFENGASAIPNDGFPRHLGTSNLHRQHYSNSSKPSKGRTLGSSGFEQDFDFPLQNGSPSLPSYSGFGSIPNNSFSLPNRVSSRTHPVSGENSFRTSGATIPKMTRRQRTRSSKSPKGRAMVGARSRACRYPDISEDSSEVEFFTANSYSDTESNAEWLADYKRSNTPVQDSTSDLINVGSSEDEISVVFTSVSPLSRGTEQRRGTSRTLGRRYNRGSRRHVFNTQDVVSLSPDPVEQVRQMEEDERFARMLQAQFDAETDPTYIPPNLVTADSVVVMRDASSSESDSMDLEVLPHNSPPSGSGFFTLVNQYNLVPAPSSPGRLRFRTRPRPETRIIRRRWQEDIPIQASSLTRLLMAGAFDSSDDSYEAFLALADDVPRGLQKGEINRLPTRKFVTMNGTSSNGAELPHKRAELNKECQVCLSDYVNGDVLRILPCFHEFHTPCIDPWLKINHTCPVCRVNVDLGESYE